MNAIGASRTLRAVFLTVAALVLINAAWRSFENYPLIQGRRAHRWLVDLAAEDITIRQRAADVLRREPALAVPVLTQALLNREQPFGDWLARQANRIAPQFFELRDHTAVRSAAARLLGSVGSSASPAVPALIVGATALEWRLREDAAVALMELGPLAAPTLATTLGSESDNTTALRCAEILRRMGPAAAVAIDQILSGFNDGRPAIRVALAPVLGQEWANTEKVITALTAATKSVHEGLQVAALRALGAASRVA